METITNDKIKYFAYVRKSSEDKERQALSISSQKEKILAAFPNLDIEFIEEEKSAFIPYHRDKFTEMIERITSGDRQGLVAWHPDRLSRNEIDASSITYCIRTGKIQDLKFVTYHFENGPEGIWMLQMALSQSQYESAKKGRDVRRGVDKKIALGQPPWKSPEGYINTKHAEKGSNSWIIDPPRAETVKQIYDWYDNSGYSIEHIIMKLKEIGYKTKAGPKKKGANASKASTSRILRNIAYTGKFYCKKELHIGQYPPIISVPQYERVQARLDGRTQWKARTTRLEYEFKGLCRCGECHMSTTAERQKGHVYYRCTKSKGGSKSCSQSYIREEQLGPQFVNLLKGILLNKQDIKDIQSHLKDMYVVERGKHDTTLKNLRTELTKLEEERKSLYQKLLLSDLDTEFREAADSLRLEKEGAIKSIKSQIDRLNDNAYDWLDKSSNILKLAVEAPNLFHKATLEEKRQLLDLVSSNRILRDQILLYDYTEPFDLAVKIKSGQMKRPDNLSDRFIWLSSRVTVTHFKGFLETLRCSVQHSGHRFVGRNSERSINSTWEMGHFGTVLRACVEAMKFAQVNVLWRNL